MFSSSCLFLYEETWMNKCDKDRKNVKKKCLEKWVFPWENVILMCLLCGCISDPFIFLFKFILFWQKDLEHLKWEKMWKILKPETAKIPQWQEKLNLPRKGNFSEPTSSLRTGAYSGWGFGGQTPLPPYWEIFSIY